MRNIARTIGLILLAAYPVGLSAQVASYPNTASSTNDITPTAYQQPVASRENINVDATPQPTPAASSPLPLKPQSPAKDAESSKRPGGLSSIVTVGGSLAVVLGIFFLIVWMLRRASPGRLAILPGEAFEVLGRAPLANHQQAHLLRCGNKLLLVFVTATSAETLTEITDPAEVDRLTGLCRQTRPNSAAVSFRQVFRQVEKHHA